MRCEKEPERGAHSATALRATANQDLLQHGKTYEYSRESDESNGHEGKEERADSGHGKDVWRCGARAVEERSNNDNDWERRAEWSSFFLGFLAWCGRAQPTEVVLLLRRVGATVDGHTRHEIHQNSLRERRGENRCCWAQASKSLFPTTTEERYPPYHVRRINQSTAPAAEYQT